MKQRDRKEIVIGTRLPLALVEQVDAAASREGISRSDIVRRLIMRTFGTTTENNHAPSEAH